MRALTRKPDDREYPDSFYEWYEAYAERVAADGNGARLVQMFHFDAN